MGVEGVWQLGRLGLLMEEECGHSNSLPATITAPQITFNNNLKKKTTQHPQQYHLPTPQEDHDAPLPWEHNLIARRVKNKLFQVKKSFMIVP